MGEEEERRAQPRKVVHACEVEGERRCVGGDKREDPGCDDVSTGERRKSDSSVPRRDGIAFVPFILRVEHLGETEENICVFGEGVLGLEPPTGDRDLPEMLVLELSKRSQ